MKNIVFFLITILLISCESAQKDASSSNSNIQTENRINELEINNKEYKPEGLEELEKEVKLEKNEAVVINREKINTLKLDENVNEYNYQDKTREVDDNIASSYDINNTDTKLVELNLSENKYKDSEIPEVTIVEASLTNMDKIFIKEYNNVMVITNNNGLSNKHPELVLRSFLDTSGTGVLKSKSNDIKIKMISYQNYSTYDLVKKGISIHSYGSDNLTDVVENHFGTTRKYFDSFDKKTRMDIINKDISGTTVYYSDTIRHENKYNTALKVSSIGNESDSGFKTKNFTKSFHAVYGALSPEVQSILRSEMILARIGNTTSRFYQKEQLEELVKLEKEEGKINSVFQLKYNFSDALGLRALTVSAPNFISGSDGQIDYGSSFSAPRVARLAYDLKVKFPFLSYHQIKQIILTTARKSDNGGYLDDKIGWGQIDRDKALNGPSDFNAGLIDEQKWFIGEYDKIFDKKGNRYFYVNIKKDESATFSNDITSGLKGDGTTKKSRIYYAIAKSGNNNKAIRFRLPKVLDSERLYYRNIATAGLRKDGLGTLILTGKQLYDTNTEILDGKLILKNDSNSNYLVFKKGIFEVENKEKKLKLNSITNDGIVNINSDIQLEKYAQSKDSTINFSGGSISGAKLKILGKINVENNKNVLKNTEEFKEIFKNSIVEEININTDNPYLEYVEIKENKLVKIIPKVKLRSIKELSEKELRNIQAYDINSSAFFEEYLSSEDKNLENVLPLITVKAKSSGHANSKIFTNSYTDVIASIFENNYEIENIKLDNILEDISKNNNIRFDGYISTNIVGGSNYSRFKKIDNSYILSYNKKLNEFNKLGIYGLYSKTKYDFDKQDSVFRNNKFELGFIDVNKINSFKVSNDTNLSMNLIDVKRNILKDNVSSKLNAVVMQNNTVLSYNFNINKLKLRPFISNTIQTIIVLENKKENSNLGLKIKKNILFNDKISLGLQLENNLSSKLEIINRVKLDFNLVKRHYLLASLLDKNLKLYGSELNTFLLDYKLGVRYNLVSDLKVGIDANINTNKKFGIKLLLVYTF
ncbi:autotransporter domain-containing protein [Oceanivirga miroungae]|uniref:Outer membrane autotransporter barrel domain-containing protein n=1 Tax=Oceanivirga miroungae TaxID=1130046 RepID=A0A6I8M606_9FUSO|nr:autotransporter domain-containing protein [Oceanivirga miroungae]VWL85379.1 outer membrane autotransporter barrel domain-containing protein [Oceanivirga miroungae]